MLGILVATLVEFIEAKGGAVRRAQLCEAAGFAPGEKIRFDTEYDDRLWQRLYQGALAGLAADDPARPPPAAVEREYAFFAGEWLARRFPGMLDGVGSARDLLLRQPRIHNTLGRAHRSAATRQRVASKFSVEEQGDALVVTYTSPNDMPGFYRSLVEWVGLQFRERIAVDHGERRDAGRTVHVFRLRFLGPLQEGA